MTIHELTLGRLHSLQTQLDALDQNAASVTVAERCARDGFRLIIKHTIEAAEQGLPLEHYAKTSEGASLSDEWNTNLELLAKDVSVESREKCKIQLEALGEIMMEGVVPPFASVEEALRFENKAQLEAYFTVSGEGEEMDFVRTGISIEEALATLSHPQQYAVDKGIDRDIALQFYHYPQVEAFLKGLPLNTALLFKDWQQGSALDVGDYPTGRISIKDALCTVPDSEGCLSFAGENQEQEGSLEL